MCDRIRTNDLCSGSFTHEYWKHFYTRQFEALGCRVAMEAPRNVGRIDVLATRASERVADEVETGKSDVVWNVIRDLLARCNRVIVVATNEEALQKLEQQLAESNLIIPQRVTIVLRDEYHVAA